MRKINLSDIFHCCLFTDHFIDYVYSFAEEIEFIAIIIFSNGEEGIRKYLLFARIF